MKLQKKILSYAQSNANFYQSQFKLYGWVLLIAYPLFYYLNTHIFNTGSYENVYLRSSIACIGIVLVLKNYWSPSLVKLAPWIWWATLTYTLPFFFTFMLLNNIEDTNWILSGFFALVTLALFVDGWLYITLEFIGIALGIVCYKLFSTEVVITHGLLGIVTSYMVLLVYYMLFAQKKKSLYNAKLSAMKGLAGSIAHEMRTPLAAILCNTIGLRGFFAKLKKPSSSQKESGLAQDHSDIPHDITEIPDDIENIVHHANTTINILLNNVRGLSPNEIQLEPRSMKESVEQALNEYPFLGATRNLVSFDPSIDFKFLGNQDLFSQILYNLIKNSLYYIQKARKGKIYIHCELGETHNTLHFKDTGEGIDKKTLSYIFDPFFSKTKHGSGLGLFFCQSAMKHLNGTIKCNSSYGDFTEFTLEFPCNL